MRWAFVAAVVAVMSSSALAAPVLLLLPTVVPDGVAREPLHKALTLYTREFQPLVQRAPLTGTPPQLRAQAVEWARSRESRWVVVCQVAATTTGLLFTAWVVDAVSPLAPDEAFTVKYPEAPDAAFYRDLGLRVATLLRAATLRGQSPQASVTSETPASVAAAPTEAAGPSITLALEGVVRGELSDRLRVAPAFGGAVHVGVGRWAFGVGAAATLRDTVTAATGTGVTETQRLCASVRRAVWQGPTLGVWVALTAGGQRTQTVGTLAETGEVRTKVSVVPLVGAGALLSVRVARHFSVLVGPDLVFYPNEAVVLVQGEEVSTTARLRASLDARLQLDF